MTREEALKLLGNDWCAVHNREKEYGIEALFFSDIDPECPDCVMQYRRQKEEAKRLLRSEEPTR